MTIGVINGAVVSNIDRVSIKHPTRISTKTIVSMVCIGVQPSPVPKSATACVNPMIDSTKFRKTAAIMINLITAVVRMVPSIAWRNISRVGMPFVAASANTATTPSEAASVGGARPA